MSIEYARRILARLPEMYSKQEPVTTEEFNAPNGSFETAGATPEEAAEWTRTTNTADYVDDPETMGRLLITLADPPEDDPLTPVVRGSYAFVLGEKSVAKPNRPCDPGNFVQIQSTYRFEIGGQADITHIAFRFAYLSETDWSAAGTWKGELRIDSTTIWQVDLFGGATIYASNQEVEIPSSVGAGYHTITFRLLYSGGSVSERLPTFLIDDVRMLRRTETLATILWVILFSIGTAQKAAHDARHAVRDLISLGRSAGLDLEVQGAEVGFGLPVTLGLSDAQYADLIRLLTVEPKCTLKAIRDVIFVITGSYPTFVSTGPVGSVPPTLTITLGGSPLSPEVGAIVDFFLYG